MGKFDNPTIISTGRKLEAQVPIIDKHNFTTLSDVQSSITDGDVVSWYASMDMYLDSDNSDYVWLDVALLSPSVDVSTKLLPTDHNYGVHPNYKPNTPEEILYYNRSFNFFKKVGTGGTSGNVDGGRADSIYTISNIDGGGAS